MDEAKQWLSPLVVTKTMRVGFQARQCGCWLTSCDVNPGPGTINSLGQGRWGLDSEQGTPVLSAV